MTQPFDLDRALTELTQAKGSDLHLGAGSVPMMRVDGELTPMTQYEAFTPDSLRGALLAILTPDQRERMMNDLELDLAYAAQGVGRFRVNMFWQRSSPGAVFRHIESNIQPLEKLGMPAKVRDFAFLPRGMVLVTGPTGSGKSTTLASIIDVVNEERACHIMTVEDPIEYLHRNKKSIVNQREVGSDTHNFASALKHVLRQDPDVILVGELRDLESISVALTAAETGHLVLATLHTVDAAQSVDRIIDVFPPEQQGQIKTQLAGSLRGVISQTLLRKKGGGRVVATELLTMTPAVGNLVREGKTHQIYSTLQSGAEYGMHTMDQSLAELVNRGIVSYQEAKDKAGDLPSFEALVGMQSGAARSTMASGYGNDPSEGDLSAPMVLPSAAPSQSPSVPSAPASAAPSIPAPAMPQFGTSVPSASAAPVSNPSVPTAPTGQAEPGAGGAAQPASGGLPQFGTTTPFDQAREDAGYGVRRRGAAPADENDPTRTMNYPFADDFGGAPAEPPSTPLGNITSRRERR